jgi:hypothetical protein
VSHRTLGSADLLINDYERITLPSATARDRHVSIGLDGTIKTFLLLGSLPRRIPLFGDAISDGGYPVGKGWAAVPFGFCDEQFGVRNRCSKGDGNVDG